MPIRKIHSIFFVFYLVSLVMFCEACQVFRPQASEERLTLPGLESVVVVGFQSLLSQRDEPKTVRSPISGSVFSAAPVPEMVVNEMTGKLFDAIAGESRYKLISPGQARGVYLGLISSGVKQTEFEMLQKIGQVFSADAVLFGYLYRWREPDLDAERPASVAFDLNLIRTEDGTILWRGKFDKTQQSLTDNLLDWDTFVKGQGRWMAAEKLAEMGLEDLLSGMPVSEIEKKD